MNLNLKFFQLFKFIEANLFTYFLLFFNRKLLQIILIKELFSIINCSFMITNFSTINYNRNNTYDFMSIIFNNEIYSYLSIGTPQQKLKIILNGNEQTFYITEKTYNHSLSSTYKGAKNSDVYFLDNINSGLKSNDTGYFNIKIKNDIIQNETCLKYALVYSSKYNIHKKIDGVIGLQLKIPNYIGIPNFIDNLKGNKFINTYQWTIIYNKIQKNNKNYKLWDDLLYNDNIGEFLVGFNEDEYSDIFKIGNKKYEIKSVKAEKDKDAIIWSLYFEDIYLRDMRIIDENVIINDENINKKYLQNKFAYLLTTKDYNIGTKEFQSLINEEFFNYYFENNICNKNKIIYDYSYETFSYYVCDNITGNFILENLFPNIVFFHHDLNYTFELSYKDLFYTDIDDKNQSKFYFNIIFSNSGRSKWSLGKPFLRKFLFIFEYDKKLIQLLSIKNDKDDNNNIYDNSINNDIYKIIIIIILAIILGIIIFLIGSFLGKKYAIYKRKNKKRANELEDEIISEKNIN